MVHAAVTGSTVITFHRVECLTVLDPDGEVLSSRRILDREQSRPPVPIKATKAWDARVRVWDGLHQGLDKWAKAPRAKRDVIVP
ncbi:MAG: hypothetical protein Kow0047_06680 [Anaerolineae bacterium]